MVYLHLQERAWKGRWQAGARSSASWSIPGKAGSYDIRWNSHRRSRFRHARLVSVWTRFRFVFSLLYIYMYRYMNVHMWCVGRARLPFTEGSLSSLAYLVAAAVVAFGLLLCMEAGLGLCVKGISALVPCEFDGIWDPDWIGCPVLLKKWKLCLRAGALILQLYDVEPIIRLKMPRLIQLVPPSRASATSHPGRKTERNIVGSIIWVSDILGLGQISCTIESHPFSVLSFFFLFICLCSPTP